MQLAVRLSQEHLQYDQKDIKGLNNRPFPLLAQMRSAVRVQKRLLFGEAKWSELSGLNGNYPLLTVPAARYKVGRVSVDYGEHSNSSHLKPRNRTQWEETRLWICT
jgi:hypothetical protein